MSLFFIFDFFLLVVSSIYKISFTFSFSSRRAQRPIRTTISNELYFVYLFHIGCNKKVRREQHKMKLEDQFKVRLGKIHCNKWINKWKFSPIHFSFVHRIRNDGACSMFDQSERSCLFFRWFGYLCVDVYFRFVIFGAYCLFKLVSLFLFALDWTIKASCICVYWMDFMMYANIYAYNRYM